MELDITIEIVDYKTPFKIKSNLEHQWINKNQIDNYGLETYKDYNRES